MKLFDAKGMMVFPNPKKMNIEEKEEVIVVQECFCPNGHKLITTRAVFNEFPGIMLKVKNRVGKEGYIALSPICGDKARISLDIDLENNEKLDLFCPECGVKLPVYSPCSCGGELVTLFSDNNNDYANCIGICNRVGCKNAKITVKNELLKCSDVQMRKEGRWRQD